MINLDPFRKHNHRIILSGGLVVEIIRLVVEFYEIYRDLLSRSDKVGSDVHEIARVLKGLGDIDEEKKRHYIRKNLKKKFLQSEADFKQAFSDLDTVIQDLTTIIMDDETLIFREANSLAALQSLILKLVMPVDQRRHLLEMIDQFILRLVQAQHHFWIVAKADARGFIKIEELSLRGPRSHRRHLKQQAIEVRNLLSNINNLKDSLHKHQDHVDLFQRCTELVDLYRKEFENLALIMHEGHVLIHTSEKLFKKILEEANHLGFADFSKGAVKVENNFKRLLVEVQKQALREYLDLENLSKKAVQRTAAFERQAASGM